MHIRIRTNSESGPACRRKVILGVTGFYHQLRQCWGCNTLNARLGWGPKSNWSRMPMLLAPRVSERTASMP
jgi:hypothetical protein